MNRHIALAVVASAVLLLSGCGDTGGKLAYSGIIEVQNDTFVMNGSVGEEYASGPGQYRDVKIHLADDTGSVYRTVSLGDISVEAEIMINDSRIPMYVVVDSPDIWGGEEISTSYYERTVIDDNESTAYVGIGVSDRSELPVELPVERMSE